MEPKGAVESVDQLRTSTESIMSDVLRSVQTLPSRILLNSGSQQPMSNSHGSKHHAMIKATTTQDARRTKTHTHSSAP